MQNARGRLTPAVIICAEGVTKTLRIMTSREAGSHRTIKRFLLAMKLVSFFLFITCMQASAIGNAQKVSISGKQMRITEVLKQIGIQSGHEVIFTDDIFQNTALISLKLKNVEVSTALDECFKGKPFIYEIMESVIVVKPAPAVITDGLNYQSFISPFFNHPPITIRGRIVNEKGEPVVASIVIKGTNRGVTSDVYGNFELKDVHDQATLIISATNISSKEIKINGKEIIVVNVSVTANPLDEVVFKGYYNEKKRLSTGTVGKVSNKEIENQPVTSPLLALQGRIAGVQVAPNSGAPGSGVSIRIRGQNSLRASNIGDGTEGNLPLYVIDGVPVDAAPVKSSGTSLLGGQGFDPLSTINPANIESIEILKDADATSIYGSRGANGVVLITTKNRRAGNTVSVDANAYKGVGSITRKINLLNTKQYLEMRHEAIKNGGQDAKDLYDNPVGGSKLVRSVPDIITGAGFGNMSKQEVDRILDQGGSHLNFFTSPGRSGISGHFTASSAEPLLQALYMYLSNPRADTATFLRFKSELIKSGIHRKRLIDSINEVSFGIRSFPPPSTGIIDSIQLEKALHIYKEVFGNPTSLVFVFTGNFDLNYLINLLAKYLSIPANKQVHDKYSLKRSVKKEAYSIIDKHSGGQYLTSLFMGNANLSFKQRVVMDVFVHSLDYVLFNKLRQEMGGAYSVDAFLINNFSNTYSVAAGFSSVHESFGTLIDSFWVVVERLREKGPDSDIFVASVNAKKMEIEKGMNNPDFWQEYFLAQLLNGYSIDQITDWRKVLSTITPWDMQQCGQKILTDKINVHQLVEYQYRHLQ